jgi:ribosomal protein L7/L12
MDMDSTARSQIEALRVRIEELERHMRQVFDHLGLVPPETVASTGDDITGEILSLVQQGKEIHAIKTYRIRTGADLASAKAAVDRMKLENGIV